MYNIHRVNINRWLKLLIISPIIELVLMIKQSQKNTLVGRLNIQLIIWWPNSKTWYVRMWQKIIQVIGKSASHAKVPWASSDLYSYTFSKWISNMKFEIILGALWGLFCCLFGTKVYWQIGLLQKPSLKKTR